MHQATWWKASRRETMISGKKQDRWRLAIPRRSSLVIGRKWENLLTHLTGAKLRHVAIGIPFVFSHSRKLEQGVHFKEVKCRLSWEWHERDIQMGHFIPDIVARTDGKIIHRGTTSGKELCVNMNVPVDGPVSLHVLRPAWREEQLEVLWELWEEMPNNGYRR